MAIFSGATQRIDVALERKNFLGYILILYLAVDPFYDWISTAEINNLFPLIRLSDLISSLFLLVLFFYVLALKNCLKFDAYVYSIFLLLCYRLIVDLNYDDTDPGQDIPRMLLNIFIYLAATIAVFNKRKFFLACVFSLFVYYAGAIGQISEGIYRVSSIYLIPNFLAFNALNMYVMFRLFGLAGGRESYLAGFASIALIMLSKTRTVLLCLAFFYFTINSSIVRYSLVLLVGIALLIGAGESVRVASDVDDFWNFDGRVPIWMEMVYRFPDFNLIFGSGTDVMRRYEVFPMYDVYSEKIGFIDAQNHYLQLLVEVGFFGVVIWFIGIFGYINRLLSTNEGAVARLGMAYITSLLVIQIFENDIFVNPTVSLVMGILVSRSFFQARSA